MAASGRRKKKAAVPILEPFPGERELRLTLDRKAKEIADRAKPSESLDPLAIGSILPKFNFPALTPEQLEAREKKRQEKIREAIQVQRMNAIRRLQADCGARLADATLDNFETYAPAAMAQTLVELRRYCSSIAERIAAGDGLFFIGPPGTGKDHLSVAVAVHAIQTTGATARWLDAASLRSQLRDSIKSSDLERRILDPYVRTGILILSDPVAPGDGLTMYQADALFRLIDGRYRAKRPTFVTSNLRDQAEASSALGSQIVDRLSHGGLRLKCVWESYRTKGRT